MSIPGALCIRLIGGLLGIGLLLPPTFILIVWLYDRGLSIDDDAASLTVTERIAQTAVWLLVLGLLIGILLGIRWLTTIASRMVASDCAGQNPADIG